jgi:hypothetical protein
MLNTNSGHPVHLVHILHLNSSDVIFMQCQSGVVILCIWKHHRRCYIRVAQSQCMSKFMHCCVQQILTWNKHQLLFILQGTVLTMACHQAKQQHTSPSGRLSTRTTPNTAVKWHLSCFVPCSLLVQLSNDRQVSELSWNTAFPLHCVQTSVTKLKPALCTAIKK